MHLLGKWIYNDSGYEIFLKVDLFMFTVVFVFKCVKLRSGAYEKL